MVTSSEPPGLKPPDPPSSASPASATPSPDIATLVSQLATFSADLNFIKSRFLEDPTPHRQPPIPQCSSHAITPTTAILQPPPGYETIRQSLGLPPMSTTSPCSQYTTSSSPSIPSFPPPAHAMNVTYSAPARSPWLIDRPSPQLPSRTLHSFPQTILPSSCWGPSPLRYTTSSSSHDSSAYRIRMDPPRFDGTDAHNWIRNIHYYFNHTGTPEEQRLQFVLPLFDSPAADWIWNYCESHASVTWLEFLDDVRQRFDPNYYQNYVGLLSKLTQTGTIAEYQAAFEALQNNFSGLSEYSLLAIFIAGLRQPFQGELQLHQPTSLSTAFALAKHLDACRSTPAPPALSAPRRPWLPRDTRPFPALPSTATSAPPPTAVSRPSTGPQRPSTSPNYLSSVSLRRRRPNAHAKACVGFVTTNGLRVMCASIDF